MHFAPERFDLSVKSLTTSHAANLQSINNNNNNNNSVNTMNTNNNGLKLSSSLISLPSKSIVTNPL
jgi:hypothetical protein